MCRSEKETLSVSNPSELMRYSKCTCGVNGLTLISWRVISEVRCTMVSSRWAQRAVIQTERYCNKFLRFKLIIKNKGKLLNKLVLHTRLYVTKNILELLQNFWWEVQVSSLQSRYLPMCLLYFLPLKNLWKVRGFTCDKEVRDRGKLDPSATLEFWPWSHSLTSYALESVYYCQWR